MLSLAPLFLCLALAPQADPPLATVLAEVQALEAEGQHERALQTLEALRAARPAEVGIERALARALERFVDAGGTWLALSDARDAWDRALALAPGELELECGAIAVRLRLGEHAAALAQAERALGAAWLAGGVAPPALLELACRARLGTLPARDTAEVAARTAALAQAWAALRHARALAPDSRELVRLSAGLLEAEGLSAQAAAELVAALERDPAASELHRALVELHVREGLEERLSPLYERWGASGTNATRAWYTGHAWHLAGDLAQRERRFAPALEAYGRAAQWMGVAGTLEPERRAAAEAVRFQVELAAGWCELETGALDAASARLLALLRADPARRDERDGLGRSLLDALAALGAERVALHDFARGAAEARALVTLLPEAGAWWNNLGFLLREHGTQLHSGKLADGPASTRETRAREVYRESWQAYLRAVELLPADPSVLNDAALVQVYHLRDNLAEAEALLERAVQLAEQQLALLGEAPEARARFPLAQALGDACENLGYLNYHVYRQSERARAAFERALASDSGPRPDLPAYLEALAGARALVPEADRDALIQAPLAAPAARALPAWEGSLAEARARAQAENRTLVFYARGEGLGRELDQLDQRVISPAFVAATQGALWLVGDARRHTFVERRHDGRRVECPRFGGLTCGEHQGVLAELRAWLEAELGVAPGPAEEGLWCLAPGAEVPVRVADPAQLSELVAPPAAPAHGPFEAIEASLGGDAGGGEARALVATRQLAARLACEQILWDGFRSGPARGHLLAALAEDPSAASRELLAACARQSADPELQRAALEVWPAGAELAPVRHAWQWALEAETRAAAERILRREDPEAGIWAAREVLAGR